MRRPDWRALLNELDPQELKWWRAAYEAVPLGDSWRQTDTICGVINDAFERFFALKIGQSVDPSKLYQPGDFIPSKKTTPRGQITVNTASIAADERRSARHY
jgi:hypothetical protein